MPFKQYEYRTLQTRSGATVGVGGPSLQCVHELKTPTINSASCSSTIQVYVPIATMRDFIVVLYSKSYISPR